MFKYFLKLRKKFKFEEKKWNSRFFIVVVQLPLYLQNNIECHFYRFLFSFLKPKPISMFRKRTSKKKKKRNDYEIEE